MAQDTRCRNHRRHSGYHPSQEHPNSLHYIRQRAGPKRRDFVWRTAGLRALAPERRASAAVGNGCNRQARDFRDRLPATQVAFACAPPLGSLCDERSLATNAALRHVRKNLLAFVDLGRAHSTYGIDGMRGLASQETMATCPQLRAKSSDGGGAE